jgi:NifU-like protein
MATVEITQQDQMVCYCLGLRESQIKAAVVSHDCDHLRAVMNCTGAGTGCTACHRRIQNVLNQELGAQCPPSSSPTCVTR